MEREVAADGRKPPYERGILLTSALLHDTQLGGGPNRRPFPLVPGSESVPHTCLKRPIRPDHARRYR